MRKPNWLLDIFPASKILFSLKYAGMNINYANALEQAQLSHSHVNPYRLAAMVVHLSIYNRPMLAEDEMVYDDNFDMTQGLGSR